MQKALLLEEISAAFFDMATVELHCRGKFGKFGSHRLSVLSYLFLMVKESGSQSL